MGYEHPFWQQYDRLFKSDRGWRLKLLGAFSVGLVFGVIVGIKLWIKDGNAIGVVVVPPVLGLIATVVVIPFVIADAVERRIRDGERVSFALRLFFGPGGFARALRITLISLFIASLVVAPLIIFGGR